MPRQSDRLDEIISAALRVFTERGYRRTQMADVAEQMGVSPGTLYNYVESKEALFHLLIDRAFLDAPAPATLPIATPPAGATLARLRDRLAADLALHKLDAALGRERARDPRAELEEIVRELYALIEKHRLGVALLDRSALELPELAQVYVAEVQRGLLDRLERYLDTRTRQGQFRPVPDIRATARLIVETAAWFAMHRHHHPGARAIGDHAALQTVVHFIVNALASLEAPGAKPSKERRR